MPNVASESGPADDVSPLGLIDKGGRYTARKEFRQPRTTTRGPGVTDHNKGRDACERLTEIAATLDRQRVFVPREGTRAPDRKNERVYTHLQI